MSKPEVIDGNVTLTDMQFQLLLTAAAQCDFANLHGDSDCSEAAWHNAKLALASLGELTAEEERDAEEEEDCD